MVYSFKVLKQHKLFKSANLSKSRVQLTNATTATRRLSVRGIATKHGVPTGAVLRAIESGELSAVMIKTPSGQERYHIAEEDAERWIESLRTDRPTGESR